MQVKDRVLEALEGHRGTYFSGEALAKELQVSRNAGGGPARGHLHESGFTPASGGGGP